jgi:hypothetical protein
MRLGFDCQDWADRKYGSPGWLLLPTLRSERLLERVMNLAE